MSSQTVNLFALLSRRIDAFSDMAAVCFVSRARRIRDTKRLTKLVESPAYLCRKGVRLSPPPPNKITLRSNGSLFADGNEKELQVIDLIVRGRASDQGSRRLLPSPSLCQVKLV